MVGKGFETGDYVWAKMKGFPPWPGKIIVPPPGTKVKKSHHYVFFYGSENYAWIPDEKISLHDERLIDKYAKGKKRSPIYLEAIDKMVNASKISIKHQRSKIVESSSEKQPSPKTKSSHSSSNAKKAEIKKKLSTKRDSKKRSLPTELSGGDSSIESPSKVRRHDDDFSNLLANIPPNYSYPDEFKVESDEEFNHQSIGLPSTKPYVERSPTPKLNLTVASAELQEKKIKASSKSIGFLGLGNMGQAIVKNFLLSGHSVTLWNKTGTKCDEFVKIGAKICKTAYDVVLASDITFCCVSDSEASKAVVFGAEGVLKALDATKSKGKGYVEMTSLDPETSIAFGDIIMMKGGRYLEAPIHGSRSEADIGTLLILCSGDRSLFDDCNSCFQAVGRNSLFMGKNIGKACKISIIQNMFLGTVFGALAESLSLVEQVGVSQSDYFDVLQYGILNYGKIIDKGRSMISNNYTSDTPLRYQQKNINLGLAMGSRVQQRMPITKAANGVYEHCKLLRYEDHDVSAVFEAIRQ